ncbi:MAG: hypothetical protein Q8P51_14620 [Ignavibacteria bacterium]|nr:hypothetical protein [Ignavibacteria bacterium]
MRFRLLIVVSLLLWVPVLLTAQFYSLETKNLRLIYYTKAHEYIVPHLTRSFENALSFHSKLFDYAPSEKVSLILQDFGDYASGGANTVPYNLMGIGIAPFNYAYETMPPLERMSMMMNHELVHIATMDKPSPSDKFFRRLFLGKVAPIAEAPPSMLYSYLTSPRWNSPRWFIEGIAVFLETWMGGGLGRAQGSYDEMVFRTMVRDSAYFYDVVGLESEAVKVDFQVGANSYLYGTRFVSYLALQYGPEKLIDWFKQSDRSKSRFSSEFERLYGLSLDAEWSRWIEWEQKWQRANLDSIRLNPVTRFRPVAFEGLGSVSRAFYDSTAGVIYVAINYPGQTPHIASIDVKSGAIRRIHDIRGGALFYVTSLAYDASSRTLFYTTDNNHERKLCALDLATGKSRILLDKLRAGDLAFNQKDKSVWGIRHVDGGSAIIRVPYPYTDWQSKYIWDYPKDLFDIDISPDGTMLTGALTYIDGQQLLIKMDVEKLMKGDGSYEVLFDFGGYSPANFVFSQDGEYLYGNSYYSGVSNIFRYEFAKKDMSILTNAESGFFRPLPVSDDSLLVFHFTGKGFVPVMIANKQADFVSAIDFLGTAVINKHPVLSSWQLTPSSLKKINVDSLTVKTGTYSPMANVRLSSLYPVVEGFKEFPAYGMRFNFSDPIMLHRGDLTVSYSPNALLPQQERLHASLNYRWWQWRLRASYNSSDFYDLFGPTKSSRKGNALVLENRDYFEFDEPETMEYVVSLGAYWGLRRLPQFQNVEVETSFDKFLSLNARINYQNIVKSLGAVDDEKGLAWQLVSHTNFVNTKFYPRFHANLAYGTLLPINHSSIWLRGSAGYSFGRRGVTFSNFYLGGFGNNWVDRGDIKRYRDEYSFPGVEINNIGGVQYAKGTFEWDLPPIRFRRFGVPSFYCNWARVALFTSGISATFDKLNEQRAVGNVGGQIDFRLVLFSSLESTLSFGYAIAAEQNQRMTKEFMVSLKIL